MAGIENRVTSIEDRNLGGWAANPAGLLLARNDFLCYRPSPTAYRQRCVLCNERKAGVEMLLA